MDVRNIGPLNQVLNPEKNNILKKSNPNTALDETSNLAETWRIIVYCTLALISFSYLTSTMILFYTRRKLISDIKYRPLRLNILNIIATIILCVMFCLRTAFWPDQYPCFLIHWPAYIGFFLWCTTLVCRILSFAWVARFNLAKLRMSKVYYDNNYSSTSLALPNTPKSPRSQQNSMEKGLRNQRGTGAAALLNQFRRLERCATDKWLSRMILYPIMGLAFALALILQFVAPSLSINPLKKTCPLGYESLPLLVFLGIFLTVICPILVFLLYDINDAYGVKNELMVTLISGGLSYIGFFIIEKVIPEIGKYFGSYMFAWVSFTICHTLSITFPVLNSFAGNKKAHVNSKISRVSSFGSASDSNSKKYANFMDVLGNSEQFSRYKEFSAACFCTELILFLEEYQFLKIRVAQCCDPQLSQKKEVEVQEPDPLYIQDMKNHLLFSDMAHIFRSAPISPSLISTPCTISIAETISAARWIPFPTHELQSDYLMFYGMFFDQTSDLAINLRGSTLSTVKAMIDKDMFEITMFETARQEVLALLYQNTFDRFLKIYGVSFGERKV